MEENKNRLPIFDNLTDRLFAAARRIGITILAASQISGVAYALWEVSDKAGNVEQFPSKVEHPGYIDENLTVVTWNVQGDPSRRFREINIMNRRYSPDVFLFQEVVKENAEELAEHFEDEWHTYFVASDARRQYRGGTFGNVVMSRQQPGAEVTEKIEGASFEDLPVAMVTGLVLDVVSGNPLLFTNTKKNIQEDRSAASLTIAVRDDDELREAVVGTGHIAGVASVHARQLSSTADFIQRQRESNTPYIFCGDFNSSRAEMQETFPDLHVTNTGPTHTNGEEILDYCVYEVGDRDTVTGVSYKVLYEFPSDHYPIVFSMGFRGSSIPHDKK
jgi:exonuclease III